MNIEDTIEYQYGTKVEIECARVFITRGWKVTPATPQENRFKKFDFIIEKNGKRYKIDAKGIKRVARGDKDRSKNYTWLELQGVTGYPGWLKGEADFFATKDANQEYSFYLQRREKLVDYVRENVDLNKANNGAKLVKAPDGFDCWVAQQDRNKAYYALYTRPPSRDYGKRWDLITLVDLQHLKENVKSKTFKLSDEEIKQIKQLDNT